MWRCNAIIETAVSLSFCGDSVSPLARAHEPSFPVALYAKIVVVNNHGSAVVPCGNMICLLAQRSALARVHPDSNTDGNAVVSPKSCAEKGNAICVEAVGAVDDFSTSVYADQTFLTTDSDIDYTESNKQNAATYPFSSKTDFTDMTELSFVTNSVSQNTKRFKRNAITDPSNTHMRTDEASADLTVSDVTTSGSTESGTVPVSTNTQKLASATFSWIESPSDPIATVDTTPTDKDPTDSTSDLSYEETTASQTDQFETTDLVGDFVSTTEGLSLGSEFTLLIYPKDSTTAKPRGTTDSTQKYESPTDLTPFLSTTINTVKPVSDFFVTTPRDDSSQSIVTDLKTTLELTVSIDTSLSDMTTSTDFHTTTQNKMVVTGFHANSTNVSTDTSCEGWKAPDPGEPYYFCVDDLPVDTLSSMETACSNAEIGSTYATAADLSDADSIFMAVASQLPHADPNAEDLTLAYFKVGKSDRSACYFFHSAVNYGYMGGYSGATGGYSGASGGYSGASGGYSGATGGYIGASGGYSGASGYSGPDAGYIGDSGAMPTISYAADCMDPGRVICVGESMTTTTPSLSLSTPSLDDIYADLGVNDSDFVSLLVAVDSRLDGNGSVSAGDLYTYAFAMKQATSDDVTADELGGAVDTCGKILDKVGGASKAEVENIASNIIGVVGAAMVTANAATNSTGNNSASAESLITNTLNVMNKIGEAVSDTLSTNDSAVVLETDFVGIAVAKVDPSSHNASIATGSVNITLEDNPGMGDTPLQAASKANFSIERESESVPAEGVTKTYTFTTLYSFMKIFLTIPGDPSVYTVKCSLDGPHNETDPFLEAHITDELNVTVNAYNVSVSYSNDTDEMSIFLKGVDLGLGTVYVHTSTDQVEGNRTKRSTGSQLSAGAAVYSPRVWNETAKAWVPAPNVEIDPNSSGEEVVFKSNFMGSMTSDIVTPPNTIDFNTVFDDIGAKTRENPYVLILVCLLAGLYLILLIPIRRLDIRDYKQNFVAGRPTNLTVSCKEDIGGITHIHVWTRARDERDSLYVDWITVADPERRLTYTFLCNDWISPVQTLCYGHEIFTKDMEEGKDFVGLVKSNTKNKIFDDHLWLSVVKRPNKSNFSRVQRWSMCVSTMFLTMVVNAMWFPTEPVENPDTSSTISIGPIQLSFKTFSIAIMGSMIVIPPNLLIMLFFRRSRPFIPPGKRRKVEHERESKQALPLKGHDTEEKDKLKLDEEDAFPLKVKAAKTSTQEEVILGQEKSTGSTSIGNLKLLQTSSADLSTSSPPPPPRKQRVIIIAVIAAFLLQESAPEFEDTSLINTVSDLHGQVKPVESREPPVRPQNIEVPDLTSTLSEARLYQKLFGKLKGTLAHLLYLALLIAIVSHNTDNNFYYQNKAVKDIFELNDIGLGRIEEIYPWLRESIFPNIYPFYAYNGDVLSEEDQRFIASMDGYLLGPVRMKQNRDIAVDCDELKKAEMGRLMKVYECKAKEDTEDWNARIFATYKVNSFRPYPYLDAWDFVFLVIQCIWFLLLCYIMFKEGKALYKEGLVAYAKNPWHWVEVFNALFAFLSCVFFAMRSVEVIKAVEHMYNNRGEYVDFGEVTKWDQLYSLFIAGVLFIAILQLYQPMDFSRQLTALKVSLSHIGGTIAWYAVIFIFLLFLYSHVMTIAFGSQFGAFVEFFRSFYYLFGMLLGILKYTDLIESDSAILRILFATYMIIGNFFLLNLFLSVINDSLAYVQENPDEVSFDQELVDYLTNKLGAWWVSLTGSKVGHSKDLAKVRRGGPWNRELELYYSLLEDHQVTPIEDKQAEEHQANVSEKADKAIDLFSLAADNKLSEAEKKSMKACTQHDRNEHTVRTAIKTIIWDMLLSNDKANHFINSKLKKKPAPLLQPRPETPQEEFHCLNETSGRIGPEGGRLEVLPGTWIIIDKGTFSFPTFVRVQAYTTNLFASHVIQLESERPLAKPFKCCLPFKDGKKRDYCNVFVQRDDGPWTLSYNSVTCFSESLRCMCHPKDEERKYRIAAKATPRKTVSKAGHTLDSKLTAGAVVKAAAAGIEGAATINEAIHEHIAGEMAAKWKQISEEKNRLKNEVATEMEESKKTDEECVNSKSNLDLL
ncbi:uncharacterized protein [Watersipora subatra]|uniref:uncharacterized protein n=1 Tax=Watersipora subatra TaxID=2589382 RepID=UPI00355B6DBB